MRLTRLGSAGMSPAVALRSLPHAGGAALEPAATVAAAVDDIRLGDAPGPVRAGLLEEVTVRPTRLRCRAVCRRSSHR
jgi:hypothetical protein